MGKWFENDDVDARIEVRRRLRTVYDFKAHPLMVNCDYHGAYSAYSDEVGRLFKELDDERNSMSNIDFKVFSRILDDEDSKYQSLMKSVLASDVMFGSKCICKMNR